MAEFFTVITADMVLTEASLQVLPVHREEAGQAWGACLKQPPGVLGNLCFSRPALPPWVTFLAERFSSHLLQDRQISFLKPASCLPATRP